MRVYPKGCRWTRNTGRGWEPLKKLDHKTNIERLGAISDTWVLVQPRGKQKWWLFHRKMFDRPRFVAANMDPDVLMARAVLLGEPK